MPTTKPRTTTTRPRSIAARLIEAHITRDDPGAILAGNYDPATLALARTQARITIAMLRDHARIAQRNYAYLRTLPDHLSEQVKRYLQR